MRRPQNQIRCNPSRDMKRQQEKLNINRNTTLLDYKNSSISITMDVYRIKKLYRLNRD